MKPVISLSLCTVRWRPYLDHPDWDAVGKVVTDLSVQRDAPPFELVVVDGCFARRREAVEQMARSAPFAITHLPPRADSPWVRMKKVAISTYRNTGIAAASGELIVNLDDTCDLPDNFVYTFMRGWKYGVTLAMIWPKKDYRSEGRDHREVGRVRQPGQVFGFGSYSREMAVALNGYNEAYDGGQGLEDIDWSTRLFNAGAEQALWDLPGFNIPAQTGRDPEAINPVRPIVKCCNAAWQCERVWRQVQVTNTRDLWSREALERLVGPCIHLWDGRCAHHAFRLPCAYLGEGFATALDPEAAIIFDEPPIIDLRALSMEAKRG